MVEATHTLTEDARPRTPATKLWTWDGLRYRGSGWWLDAILPRSPAWLLVAAFGVPLAWFAVGFAITDDQDAYLATHDVTGQLWFFPLHVLSLRLVGGLWATGLAPALGGLGLSPEIQRKIRRGALGTGASLGALAACAFFIIRDTTYGFTPNPESGLIPFDDPDLWGFGALGRPVHVMMLSLWCVEWLMFGYLLWLQLWILAAWTRHLASADLGERLGDILVGDGYRHSFALFGKTTTVSLVFAIGNLGFIAFTGELIPREVVVIEGVGDFIRQMSDLLSTALLFVFTLIAAFAFVRVLRSSLTRAVNAKFAEAGDIALAEIASPLESTGSLSRDVERLRARANAQAGLIRAVVFQREVDVVGAKTMAAMIAKSLVPLATTALKLRKILGL